MSNTDNNAERQARYYQRSKAGGTLKKPIKVDAELKQRFDDWRNEKGLSVNDAFEHLLRTNGL